MLDALLAFLGRHRVAVRADARMSKPLATVAKCSSNTPELRQVARLKISHFHTEMLEGQRSAAIESPTSRRDDMGEALQPYF